MTPTGPQYRSVGYAIFLLLTGASGWVASFILVLERMTLLERPGESLACDVNPFVSCGTVIESWQGSLFGFPNPLLGVAGFVAPMAVGVGLLAGARFARWFWTLFVVGLGGAWAFVTWLFTQTVFSIGVLCPWCMLVWLATIPLFWFSLLFTASRGLLAVPAALTRAGRGMWPFAWAIVVANYAVFALIILAVFPHLPRVLFG
ncbi:vitamin K epoxide reductase family protein [Planctomonas psychrotolerans]|uniref:vitamin K epoxide reductase family protein n=1 Tax=Planctomonas psychrotolerans TaxID=2528712 RepID=UPI0012386123|nr:vitamin K epoxide reductase family protein [Planctomonas psychrotolerans]